MAKNRQKKILLANSTKYMKRNNVLFVALLSDVITINKCNNFYDDDCYYYRQISLFRTYVNKCNKYLLLGPYIYNV